MSPLSRGLIEMLGVVGAFVALGLVGQDLGAPPAAEPPRAAYPLPMDPADDSKGTVWLVDGYNVLCSGLLGGRERSRWWSEERRRELLERLEAFDDPAAEIWVVFDGESPAGLPHEPSRIRTVFAPSADDWLVSEVNRRAAETRPVAVVTADRKVAGRSRHGGAEVVAPRALLGRCMG
jgi:predicted RNA-binding protein with PIN domain